MLKTGKIKTHLHKITCANCGRTERIEIDDNGKILTPNWLYFGKVNINFCATSKYFYKLDGDMLDKKAWKKISNPCYNPKTKREIIEYWKHEYCGGKKR